MKILHITKKYPNALGGDAVVVHNLQKQQEAAGHTVYIVTSRCDEIKDGRRIYKFGLKDTSAGLDSITFKRILSLVALFFTSFWVLRQVRPDVIHTHSVDMAFFASFAARFFNIPVIHTFHIVTFYDTEQPAIRRKSELWLAKNARFNHVTAPNTHDVRRLQAAGLTQAILLPNGVNLEDWQTTESEHRHKRALFLAVGRLEDQKGYEYLIRAASLLESIIEFSVVIVGEGSQKAALKKLIKKLGIEETVFLAGRKNQQEINALLKDAHAAVFPSLYETTPLTLLEAWATKTAAIATPVGILHDAGSHFNAAYIVPARDKQALATAMLRCVEDNELRQATANAGHKQVEKYAWPIIARQLESIYQGAQ